MTRVRNDPAGTLSSSTPFTVTVSGTIFWPSVTRSG